jgi:hypothetical protein
MDSKRPRGAGLTYVRVPHVGLERVNDALGGATAGRGLEVPPPVRVGGRDVLAKKRGQGSSVQRQGPQEGGHAREHIATTKGALSVPFCTIQSLPCVSPHLDQAVNGVAGHLLELHVVAHGRDQGGHVLLRRRALHNPPLPTHEAGAPWLSATTGAGRTRTRGCAFGRRLRRHVLQPEGDKGAQVSPVMLAKS